METSSLTVQKSFTSLINDFTSSTMAVLFDESTTHSTDESTTTVTTIGTAPIDSNAFTDEVTIVPSSTGIITPDVVMPKFPTLEDILGQYWEYNVSRTLALYGYPTIIILGTLGNILSLMVMLGKKMRRRSTCFYMSIVALFDTSVLYFSCLRQWLAILNGSDGLSLSDAACKTLNFFSYTCFDIAVWLLVVMTVDRFLVVQFPLHALKISSIPRARVVVLVLLLAMILINVHFFWTVEIDLRGHCSYLEEFEHFHSNVWPWIDATVYSFVPFTLLLLFNILIIVIYRKSVIIRRTTLNINKPRQTTQKSSDQGTQLHLSAMLLIVTLTFLLLSAPNVVLICIRHIYFDFSTQVDDFRDIAVYHLVSIITNFCLYLNHAINFILYCISGRMFRRELLRLVRCKSPRQTRSSLFSDITSGTFRLSESSAPSSPAVYRRDNENYI